MNATELRFPVKSEVRILPSSALPAQWHGEAGRVVAGDRDKPGMRRVELANGLSVYCYLTEIEELDALSQCEEAR